MAGVLKRNNKKRLECLKKKSKELSVLCDVEVLFLCKEDGSFNLWPEDSNACLSLIDKYTKSTVHAKRDNPTDNLTSVLGKRKQRSDDCSISCNRLNESEEFEMGFCNGVAFEMGIFDGAAVDGQTNNLTSVLAKRKQKSDDHSISSERLHKSKEFQMGFSDGVGFHMGILNGASIDGDGGEAFLFENVQDREGLEKGIFDGVAVDEGVAFLFKKVLESERLEMRILDGVAVDDGEAFLYQKAQETEGLEMGIFDGVVAEGGEAFFFEKVQDTEGFQMGFVEDVGFDESQTSSLKNVLQTQEFRKSFLNNSAENGSSEMGSPRNFVQNFEGIVEGLGSQDLQKLMRLVDQTTERVDQRLHQLRDREEHFAIGDSEVDWEELMQILQTGDFEC